MTGCDLSSWGFIADGTVFEKTTGRGLFDALESDLVRPISMQDFSRSLHKKGGDLTRSIHPSCHMHFSTRDMARISYLDDRPKIVPGRRADSEARGLASAYYGQRCR